MKGEQTFFLSFLDNWKSDSKNERHNQIMFLFSFTFNKVQFKIPGGGKVTCKKKDTIRI